MNLGEQTYKETGGEAGEVTCGNRSTRHVNLGEQTYKETGGEAGEVTCGNRPCQSASGHVRGVSAVGQWVSASVNASSWGGGGSSVCESMCTSRPYFALQAN